MERFKLWWNKHVHVIARKNNANYFEQHFSSNLAVIFGLVASYVYNVCIPHSEQWWEGLVWMGPTILCLGAVLLIQRFLPDVWFGKLPKEEKEVSKLSLGIRRVVFFSLAQVSAGIMCSLYYDALVKKNNLLLFCLFGFLYLFFLIKYCRIFLNFKVANKTTA